MAPKRLNIAIVSDSVFPYNKGGKETRIHYLTAALARMGHDVHIYTMKWWDGGNSMSFEGVQYHAISRLHGLYSGDRRSISQGLLFALSCFNLLRYDFDIIDADHMPFLQLFPLKFVSLLKRRPLFATWHEVWGTTYWREYLGLAGYLASAIERASVHLPNEIIAVSTQTQDQLRTTLNHRGRVTLIPNGIDIAAIADAKPAPVKSDIIYAGRLISHKNVDMLINAVGVLKDRHPSIRCLIIGDGPDRRALEDLTVKLGLTANVTFAGFVPENSEVYSAMKSSQVFVLPSVREGFGVSVIEAYSAGLSVVTTNHPDNAARLLITPAHGRAVKADSQEIAAAIEELLATRKRDDQADQSDTLKAYSWEHLAAQLSGAYTR